MPSMAGAWLVCWNGVLTWRDDVAVELACMCAGALTWQVCWRAQEFEQTGTRLAQALTQKDSIARKKAAMSNDVAKALARLSSGLYIVTAAHRGGARGAMVASWVAQVRFSRCYLLFFLFSLSFVIRARPRNVAVLSQRGKLLPDLQVS